MKKPILILFGVVFFILATYAVLSQTLLHSLATQKILAAAHEAHVDLRFDRLKVDLLPIGVTLEGVSVEIPKQIRSHIETAEVSISILHLFIFDLKLKVFVDSGHFEFFEKPSTPSQTTAASTETSVPQLPLSISLKFEGRNLNFKKSDQEIELKKLEFEKSNLLDLKKPFAVAVEGDLMSLPFTIESAKVFANPTEFECEKFTLTAAGIKLKGSASGTTDLSLFKSSGELIGKDLGAIPVDHFTNKIKSLSGDLEATYMIDRAPQKALEFQIKAKSTKATATLNHPQVIGLVEVALALDVEAANNQLKVQNSFITANLNEAEIHSSYFEKPKKIPLEVSSEFSGDQKNVVLKNSHLKFAQALLQFEGALKDALTEPVLDLSYQLPQMSLSQIQPFLPMLKKSPLSGNALVQGTASIPLKDPKKLSAEVKKLELKNVKGHLQMSPALSGPFEFDLDASASIDKSLVKKLDSQGQLHFDPLNLKFKSHVTNLKNVSAELNGEVTDFKKLAAFNPNLSQIEGKSQFQIRVSGPLTLSTPVMDLSLTTTGSVKVQIPKYKSMSVVSSPKLPAPHLSAAPLKPKPFLSQQKIFNDMNIEFALNLNEAQFNQIVAKDVSLKSRFTNQGLKGEVRIGSIFDGSVTASNLSLNPFRPNSFAQGRLGFNQINVEKMLKGVKPEFADYASGIASGNLQFESPDPRILNFQKEVSANGQMQVSHARLKSAPIKAMAQKFLAKIPGVSVKTDQIQDVAMKADLNLTLKDNVANLHPFHAVSEQNDDLHFEGTVSLDLLAHLKGEMHIANSPLGGSLLKANQDEKGRLVLPLEINGNLMDPKINFAEATIERMLHKTFQLEKDNLLKNAGDQLKDKLKGIFGK